MAPGDFRVRRNTSLGAGTGGSTSSTGEPSAAMSHADSVFMTGNWYASASFDGGRTFSYIDPYTTFPASYGGFCCDQVVQYDRSHDLFIWLLQYGANGTTNIQRIAVATPADLQAGNWTYWDFTPQMLGWPTNREFDFPDLALSATFLYVTSNGFDTAGGNSLGSTVWRIPLNELAAKGSVNFNYWTRTDSHSPRLTQGAGSTMYWGSWDTTSSIRVFDWPDGSGTINWTNVGINSFNWLSKDGVATSPDGTNWAAFADSRILGAWTSGAVIGFMWNAKQGGGFAYPQVQVAQLTTAKTFVSQSQVWSTTIAWMYPSVNVDARGHLGGSIAWGGGTSYPQASVWIADDINGGALAPLENMTVTSGDHGPSRNRWGDYLTSRKHPGFTQNTWVATGYCLSGGTGNADADPRFLWFGRERDMPVLLANDTPTAGSSIPGYYEFPVRGYSWAVVGVDPSPNDHDIAADNDNDFSSTYASSSFAGTVRDFIVTNGHSWGADNHYARVSYGSTSAYTIEGEWEGVNVAVSSPVTTWEPANGVVDIFQVYLTSGSYYRARADVWYSTPDVAIYGFKPSRAQGSRGGADWSADAAGAGGDEEALFYASETGWYGFVVTHNNATSGYYDFSIAPAVQTISGHTYNFAGSPLSGVYVYTSTGGSDYSDATGFYSLTVPYGATVNMWSTLTGYGFLPISIHYASVTSDLTAQDFHGGLNLSIPQARLKPDGTSVYLADKVLSAQIGANVYVEEPNRVAGIRVDSVTSPGQLMVVGGVMSTTYAERRISPSWTQNVGFGTVKPLHMTNRNLGGGPFGAFTPGIPGATGMNNVGLLVRTEGVVTKNLVGDFYLDDGSGVMDSAPTVGVLVDTSTIGVTPPAVGKYVTVTGISGATTLGGVPIRILRPRSASDIQYVVRSVGFIHGVDTAGAAGFKSLLDSYGLPTTLIPDAQVTATDLSKFDVLIIAYDSPSYSYSDRVAAISGSGKPVIGIGMGGALYLDTQSLHIGWGPSATTSNATSIVPQNTGNPIFHTPSEVLANPLVVFSTPVSATEVYMPRAPASVTGLGQDPSATDYDPLAAEDRYLQWGFYGGVSSMTPNGKRLFVNAVHYLGTK